MIVFVVESKNAASCELIGAKKGAIFSLIYFFNSSCIYYITHNYVIPQAMPHAIPQTHSTFYPHRRFSAGCVGEFLQLLDFDTKLVKFLLKLISVTFYSKGYTESIFLISILYAYCKNGHSIKLFLADFLVSGYSCSFCFPSKYLP